MPKANAVRPRISTAMHQPAAQLQIGGGREGFSRARQGGVRLAAYALGAILAALAADPGRAQPSGRAPTVDPRQGEKSFDAFQLNQRRLADPSINLPDPARQAGSGDRRPLFKLAAVSVGGEIAVPRDQIAATYRPYIGKTVSQADLVTIAGKISDLHRAAGFYLTRAIIPPQDIKNGRIRIRVIAGSVTEIVLKGERAQKFGLSPLLDVVRAESPSRRDTLERQLLLVNDLPGVRIVDTSLEEIGQATGKFRLTVFVRTWGVYAVLGVDNRGTPEVGPLQGYVAANFNSFVAGGDTLGLNLSTVPDATRELGFNRLAYSVPVGANGARIGAMASYTEIWPGDARRALRTHTQTETYEFRGTVVAQRTRNSSLWLTASAGFSDVVEQDLSGTNYRDHVRTVSLTADYQTHDTFNGWNYLTLTLRQGLDVLGASHKGDAALSRGDGSASFSKIEMYYTRLQKLSDVWSVKLSTAGQWASTALLASQEFYLGTAFGRGYYGSDLSGDNGIAGSLELRFDQTLNNDLIKGYQAYGFIDRSMAWNFRDVHDDVLSVSLIGAGLRLFIADDLIAGVELAAPIEYRIPSNDGRGARVFFSLSKSFKLCPGSAQMRCS